MLLALLGYGTFMCIRILSWHLLKLEAVPLLHKWGGFILGIFRGIFLISIIFFALLISKVDYLSLSLRHSVCARDFLRFGDSTYRSIYGGSLQNSLHMRN